MKRPSLRRLLSTFGLTLLLAACGGAAKPGPGTTGGASGGGGTGGAGTTGGTSPTGGRSAGTGGASGGAGVDAGARGDGGGADAQGPASYALPPPRQCDNQFWVKDCKKGDPTTACGGVCQGANACEDISQKTGSHVGFLCPRFAIGAQAMLRAAIDDFGPSPAFTYGIVGHDVDMGGIDGDSKSSCCQCYQLVFDLPEAEAQVDGHGDSAITRPAPVIVQAFNTAAGGGLNFDIFMGAGGFGAFNACDPTATSQKSASGLYLYSDFPPEGEPGSGGVNAATQLAGCKNERNLVTSESLSSSTCTSNVARACSAFTSNILTAEGLADSKASCSFSNNPASYYHINWQVYAKRVECPQHLTEVTGCKLAPQGLPAPDPKVTTAAAARQDASFKGGRTTTTMQDCCKPTCAWQDYVTGNNGGKTAVGLYNSFYSCDQTGTPVTE